jgi:hypothetical protein
MASDSKNAAKQYPAKPPGAWLDPVARWLRTNVVVVAVYRWISGRLVPFLFAVFVAAPIAILILPFFLPKFYRNAARRRKYGVHLSTDRLQRMSGSYSKPGDSQ